MCGRRLRRAERARWIVTGRVVGEAILALDECVMYVGARAWGQVDAPTGPERAVSPGKGSGVVVERYRFIIGVTVGDYRERHLCNWAKRVQDLTERG